MTVRIYLDNCCYNRPYDDQMQIRIHLETEAKLHIQDMVKKGELDLVTSFMLDYENGKNRYMQKRETIAEFMNTNESYYVSSERSEEIAKIAKPIIETGIKEKDAFHVACAVFAQCDYFITTDDRLLKYQTEQMPLVTPGEFIRRLEENEYV